MSSSEIENLFEVHTSQPLFASLDDRLDALHSGGLFHTRFNTGRADDEKELRQRADSRGLVVATLRADEREDHWIDVFVAHRDHLWRISAYSELLRSVQRSNGCDDAFEHLRASLLGHSGPRWDAMIDNERRQRAGRTGLTLFMLLTENQYELVRTLGMKCLHPSSVPPDIQGFYHRKVGANSQVRLRDDAFSQVPVGLVLARAAVKGTTLLDMISGDDRDIVKMPLAASDVIEINKNLVSCIEIMHASGWK